MKQSLLPKELLEMSQENQDVLYHWYNQKGYDEAGIVPLLTIGQMIEFLHERTGVELIPLLTDVVGRYMEEDELCDALWRAIKEELTNE